MSESEVGLAAINLKPLERARRLLVHPTEVGKRDNGRMLHELNLEWVVFGVGFSKGPQRCV